MNHKPNLVLASKFSFLNLRYVIEADRYAYLVKHPRHLPIHEHVKGGKELVEDD
ncbi:MULTISPECIES: hypothetical protein [Metallosphaera]|uniref:hypothetical protein n=1 Tax=Metallosphaera TaxID=41980 RepID=UPI001F05F4AD|nr:hypothetical protein [Metallosphaera sedula]MCH1772159.1 hypothetical protein [Metallosphaera sedula]MCP6727704.1 hypothetical protein [Metallosphaera sedula]